MTEATKHDNGKPDLAQLPYAALVGMARAMDYGKVKYGADNWKKGFDDNRRVIAASLRHIYQFLDGDRNDPESGLCHLEHAIANLGFALHYIKQGKL